MEHTHIHMIITISHQSRNLSEENWHLVVKQGFLFYIIVLSTIYCLTSVPTNEQIASIEDAIKLFSVKQY